MRLGQKNGCVRQRAERGSRPRQLVEQRYTNTYMFGAVCRRAIPVRPSCCADTCAVQRHIDEIGRHVSPGAVAAMLMDNSGWHRTEKLVWPAKARPVFILASCPALDAQDRIWQYMRQTCLPNRVFADCQTIVDATCDAWPTLLAEGRRITSIATRAWAAAPPPPQQNDRLSVMRVE